MTKLDLILVLSYLLICWLIALICVNSSKEKNKERALTILLLIFPLIFFGILFCTVPNFKTLNKSEEDALLK